MPVNTEKPKQKTNIIALCTNLFWMFMIGNVAGVIVEGVISIFAKGHWESHVTLLWGPLNLVYGFAAIFIYLMAGRLKKMNIFLKFLVFAVVCTALELAVAFFQEIVFNSISWDYSNLPLNIFNGRICLFFSIGWGILGVFFSDFVFVKLDKVLKKPHSKIWTVFSLICAVVMIFNMSFSTAVLYRWGNRVKHPEPSNKFEEFADRHYPHDYLQERFCEWIILENNIKPKSDN